MLASPTGMPSTRLVVVGDGPARRRLEQLLPDAAFTGFRTDQELSALVTSLDDFVHTGRTRHSVRPSGGARGRPPDVVPASDGPLDLVRPGHNGLLYLPERPSGLRAAIAALVADPALRARIGRARPHLRTNRGWATIGDELIGHHDAVRAGTATGRSMTGVGLTGRT